MRGPLSLSPLAPPPHLSLAHLTFPLLVPSSVRAEKIRKKKREEEGDLTQILHVDLRALVLSRQAARARLEEKLAKENDGVDILAEVSAARAMARFREEDLPVNPITIRPQGYTPNKAMSEAEEFMKHIEVPRASSNTTSLEVASGGMHAVTRGRYEYLNDFMDSMEVKEEERRPMTKREIQRAQKFFKTSSGASKTIGGAFVAGTALCVGVFAASWWYTKSKMKVCARACVRVRACVCASRSSFLRRLRSFLLPSPRRPCSPLLAPCSCRNCTPTPLPPFPHSISSRLPDSPQRPMGRLRTRRSTLTRCGQSCQRRKGQSTLLLVVTCRRSSGA